MKTSVYKVLLSLALLIFIAVTSFAQQAPVFSTTSKDNTITNYYRPSPLGSIDSAKQVLSRILNSNHSWFFKKEDGKALKIKILKYKKALVFNDRIELILKSDTITLYFSKLFGERAIMFMTFYNDHEYYAGGDKYCGAGIAYINQCEGIQIPDEKISEQDLKNPVDLDIRHVADALFTIQERSIARHDDSIMAVFKPLAEKYRVLKVKPPMTEEQRKYVVQANFNAQRKNYEEAIDLYKRVITIDPTCYPTAYNNLALLFAQKQNFQSAILYMKEYLLLEPDAKDARAAQDKIYEWEFEVGR